MTTPSHNNNNNNNNNPSKNSVMNKMDTTDITTSNDDGGSNSSSNILHESISSNGNGNDSKQHLHVTSSPPWTPSSSSRNNKSSRNKKSLYSPISDPANQLMQTVVSNVTTTTKKIVDKSTETAQTLVDTTKKNTQDLVQTSKSTIESNKWLLPLKWLMHFPRHWPRTNAILWVILLLWILILISMGFGIKLAQAESPQEIAGNDEILAARATIDRFRLTPTNVLNATQQCWQEFRIESNLTNNDNGNDDNGGNDDEVIAINTTQLEISLRNCAQSYAPDIVAAQQATDNYSAIASQSLSFNWNRCWALKHQPQFLFYPTPEMIAAAHPDAQAEYYQQEWSRVQQALYQEYLSNDNVNNINNTNTNTNATTTDKEKEEKEEEQEYQAFVKSIQEATGADACEENMGGTAWFFFTIMTTVGYGNQAPVTDTGRLIVVTAGLLSLILFGAVLGLCGYVILVIFDDAVSRLHCGVVKKLLGNPVFGLLLWGTIWLLYALAMAKDFEFWWEARLPEFAADLDRIDLLWFSSISFSTIGLGDYYLQPEVIFASDTLKYSVLFMIGFVFLSTFFGKIVETLATVMPKKHNSLEHRLAKTRVLACWPHGWMPWENKPQKGDEDDINAAADTDNADDQALLYRIDRIKEIKPDPPVEEDGSQRRGLVSALTGNSIHCMNLELLQQEETLLREWLAVVQHQYQRAQAKRAAEELKAALSVPREGSSEDEEEQVGGGGQDSGNGENQDTTEEVKEATAESVQDNTTNSNK
jgi:Ion channel